jgi:hypothetical protein
MLELMTLKPDNRLHIPIFLFRPALLRARVCVPAFLDLFRILHS